MMKQESGRSMVEMLGVLAIIGVLSIGGIAGYTIAMNRYRANEVLDLAAKVSVMGMTLENTGVSVDHEDVGAPLPSSITAIAAGQNGVVRITWTEDGGDIEEAADNIAGTKYDPDTNLFRPNGGNEAFNGATGA